MRCLVVCVACDLQTALGGAAKAAFCQFGHFTPSEINVCHFESETQESQGDNDFEIRCGQFPVSWKEKRLGVTQH